MQKAASARVGLMRWMEVMWMVQWSAGKLDARAMRCGLVDPGSPRQPQLSLRSAAKKMGRPLSINSKFPETSVEEMEHSTQQHQLQPLPESVSSLDPTTYAAYFTT
jgi:hypothetical protein